MFAAVNGQLEIVKLLLNHGADINDKSYDGKFLILYFIGYKQFGSYFL